MNALSRIEQRRAALRLQLASERVAALTTIAAVRARAGAAMQGLALGRAAGSALLRGKKRLLLSLAATAVAYLLAGMKRPG